MPSREPRRHTCPNQFIVHQLIAENVDKLMHNEVVLTTSLEAAALAVALREPHRPSRSHRVLWSSRAVHATLPCQYRLRLAVAQKSETKFVKQN